MVSLRCKELVESLLDKQGLFYDVVELGEVEIFGKMSAEQRIQLKNSLHPHGLELMDDKKAILVEKIKNTIVEMIHHSEKLPKTNFSNYLSQKLCYDYTYLANLFSQTTGKTIEQYIILHRIERVKELLLYDELSLTQISYTLHYSSVSHLSFQFKKVTGLTPRYFKKNNHKRHIFLEDL